MRDSFIKIAQNYNFERSHNLKTNQNEVVQEIERNLPQRIHLHQNEFQVTGSAGKGQWAHVPWIALFDASITTSATYGYYIVYLFSKNMDTLYLSLNQGWTFYGQTFGTTEGKKQIKNVAHYWQNELSPSIDDFNLATIHLNCPKNHILTQGYELGHICGKSYNLSDLPDNAQLFDDLNKLVKIYRTLKGMLIDKNFSTIQKSIIDNCTLSETETSSINATLQLEKCPEKIHYKKHNSHAPIKVDHVRQAVHKSHIGFLGERLVLAYENDKLKRLGLTDHTPKHISQNQGDGTGYDILSYDNTGKEIYIEVKTTTQGKETPFFISKHELDFSQKHADSYYLYRVYNVGEGKPSFYIIYGDLSKHFTFEASVLFSTERIQPIE